MLSLQSNNEKTFNSSYKIEHNQKMAIKQYLKDMKGSLYLKCLGVADEFGILPYLDITDLFRPNLKKGIELIALSTVALLAYGMNPPAIHAQKTSYGLHTQERINELEKNIREFIEVFKGSADKEVLGDTTYYSKKLNLEGKYYIDEKGTIYHKSDLSRLNKNTKPKKLKQISIIELSYVDKYPNGHGKDDELYIGLFEELCMSCGDYLEISDVGPIGLYERGNKDITHNAISGPLLKFFNHFGVSRFPPSKPEDIKKVNRFYNNLIQSINSILMEMLKNKK